MRILSLFLVVLLCCGFSPILLNKKSKDYTADPTCVLAICMDRGDARDTSRAGWNGTVTGATLTTGKWSVANTAYTFDEADDYILIGTPTSASAAIGTKTTYTLIITYKTNDTTENSLYTEDAGTRNDFHQLGMGSGFFYFITKVSSASKGDVVYTNAAVTDDSWNTIIIVRETTTSLKAYFIASTTASLVDTDTTLTLAPSGLGYGVIGAHYYSSAYNEDWNGEVAQVGVFSRILTTAEMEEIHARGLKGNQI